MNRIKSELYRIKMTAMKQFIYILFFLINSVLFAQPPVNQNSVNSTNTIETSPEKRGDSENQGQIPVQQKQSFNDFLILHNKANTSSTQKNPTAKNQDLMNDFISQNFSSSDFEYNISTFMAGNFDISKKKFLDKAREMQPTNQQVLIQSIGVNYILNDLKILKSDLKELRIQKFITDDDLSYARDVLLSLPQNTTLITHGITDTYPLFYLQEVENIRKDIGIVPMVLLQSEEYYSTLKNKKSLHLPAKKVINPDFIKEFCKNNNTYLALTIPVSYFEGMKSDLFPIGLTFGYTPSEFQNSKMNQKLWETSLQKTVISKSKEKNGRQLSANYLPMLVNLYKFYESENNSKQLNSIKATIKEIGVNIGNTNLFNDLGLN